MVSITGLNQKVHTHGGKMLHVRIELTTSGLWDRRSAYWANEAKFITRKRNIFGAKTAQSSWWSIVFETKSDDPWRRRHRGSRGRDRSIPRIELGTSCTQSRNHTTRPNGLTQEKIQYLILTSDTGEWSLAAAATREPPNIRPRRDGNTSCIENKKCSTIRIIIHYFYHKYCIIFFKT